MSEFPKKELETLWAPWRVEYFEKEPRDLDFLYTAARASDDAEHLVITRRKNVFLMMNRYPYAVGHLMAVPYRKMAELSAFGDNEIVELWNLVAHAQTLLRYVTKAQGFNIGMNIGECAGAGVPDHLHIHIVPRWSGDTNFMPILAGTRMFREGLRELYDKLMDAQARIDVESRHKISAPGSTRRHEEGDWGASGEAALSFQCLGLCWRSLVLPECIGVFTGTRQ